jgi:hypothetical protein
MGVVNFDGTPPLDNAISPTDVVFNAVATLLGPFRNWPPEALAISWS